MYRDTAPARRAGAPEQFAQALAALRDPARQPALVHCQAGVARTGAAIALYRMLEQGWAWEPTLREMASYERRGVVLPELREHVLQMAARLRSDAAATAPPPRG